MALLLQLTHAAFNVVSALARLCGLCPFHLSVAPFRLTASRRRVAYAYACAGVASAVVCVSQASTFVASMPPAHTDTNESTLVIVVLLQAVFSTTSTLLMYALQLRSREHFMRLIRQGYAIFERIDELSERMRAQRASTGNDGAARKLGGDAHQMLATKYALLAAETLLMLESMRLYMLFSRPRSGYLFFSYVLSVLSTDGLTILFSAMNAMVLIAVLQMLRQLGAELVDCMRRVNAMVWTNTATGGIRMQQYCGISDTVDALSALYGEVLAFSRAMGVLFAPHVLLMLLNSFVSALAPVSTGGGGVPDDGIQLEYNCLRSVCSFSTFTTMCRCGCRACDRMSCSMRACSILCRSASMCWKSARLCGCRMAFSGRVRTSDWLRTRSVRTWTSGSWRV